MCDQFQDKVTLNESRTGAAAVVTSETASDTSSTYYSLNINEPQHIF